MPDTSPEVLDLYERVCYTLARRTHTREKTRQMVESHFDGIELSGETTAEDQLEAMRVTVRDHINGAHTLESETLEEIRKDLDELEG